MSVPPAQRIIITGGRGRLASLVADHFRASGRELACYSREAGAGFHAFNGLATPERLAGADVLLHLAWSTLPATSESGGGLEFREDLPALEKLLTALAAVPAERRPLFFMFSSGGTVYGNAPGRPSAEDDVCQPIGSYGRAKVAAEKLLATLAARHDLRSTTLRISNPYGYPVPKDRAQGIIPHAIRCAQTGQPLTLWGDGSARKDFLHHTDFLAALTHVVDRRLSGTFNLCAGESHSVHEIIGLVEKYTGRRVPLAPAPGLSWDVHDSLLSHRKFSAVSGWQPLVTLEEGLRRSVADLLAP